MLHMYVMLHTKIIGSRKSRQKKNPRLLLPSKYLKHPHEILPSLWRQLPGPFHSHTQTVSPPLVPEAVFYVLSNLWYSSIFSPPDCSVFQLQTKTLFSFFYYPVCLPNNNFIITFKSQRTSCGKTNTWCEKKKKAAHNKVAFIIYKKELTFLSYIHVKTEVHRRNKTTVFFFTEGIHLLLKICQRTATKTLTHKYIYSLA